MKPSSQPAPTPQRLVRTSAAADRRPEQPAPSAVAVAAVNLPGATSQPTDGDYPTLPPSRHYRAAHRRWASRSAAE